MGRGRREEAAWGRVVVAAPSGGGGRVAALLVDQVRALKLLVRVWPASVLISERHRRRSQKRHRERRQKSYDRRHVVTDANLDLTFESKFISDESSLLSSSRRKNRQVMKWILLRFFQRTNKSSFFFLFQGATVFERLLSPCLFSNLQINPFLPPKKNSSTQS